MKTNVKLYVFVKEDAPILATLQKDYDYVLVEDYEALKSKIDKISYFDSHLLLIDFEYLLSKKGTINKYIKKDLMRSWLAVIAYHNGTPSLQLKAHLYRLDFKAILDDTNRNIHHKIIKHVSNYANIHMETIQNNFITAFVHCNDSDNLLRDLQYLFGYVIDYYKLSDQDAADIYLVTSSLIIAIQTNRLIKTSEILYTIFKSFEVNKLYKNYATPKSFNEQIVTVLLYLLYVRTLDKKKISIDMESVQQTLIDKVTEFHEFKTILISSYMEVDIFWEQVHELLFSEYKNDDFDVIENYLEIIYHGLIRSLIRASYICVYIDRNHEKGIAIFIKLFGADIAITQECFDLLKVNENSTSKYIEKKEDGSSELVVTLNLSKKLAEVKIPSIRKSGILKQANIETMHYAEEKKMSAHAFLEEFEVDNYMLDDLNENEIEMKDLLFSAEELNDTTLEAVSAILNKYVSILHETIEFNDLAISLDSLSKVFQRLSLNMLEKEKKDKLRFFIQGLIDDLQTWKKYIFIDPNTPDIHYLDASLLENCASIEHFILTDQEDEASTEDDEDDLEFF